MPMYPAYRSDQTAEAFSIPMLIGGEWRKAARVVENRNPYLEVVVCLAPETDSDELSAALAAAQAAKVAAAAMPAIKRAAVIHRAADLLAARSDDFAQAMCAETGKAIRDCRTEVKRSAETLHLSAEEAGRIEGEHVSLDSTDIGFGKIAMLLRFPIGVVGAITPFNSPLNLACHKVGPALAAGNTVVLKASPQAPLIVHKLAELFVEAGLPAGFLNTVYGSEAGPALVRDRRAEFISFTGSTMAGETVKANSGLRRVALELGGIGPAIVHADADLSKAAPMCAQTGTRNAGQSCVSVQNIFAHEAIYDDFLGQLIEQVEMLRVGDPFDESTDIGTLIDAGAAERVSRTVDAARDAGAGVETGAERLAEAVYAPTVLTAVRPSMEVVCREIFGPVITVQRYSDVDEVIKGISQSPLGLQGGVFTGSVDLAIHAARTMRTGGVIINGTPTWRSDQGAYGGVKDSGMGREGPRYAIREMTEQRLIVFNM